MAGRESDVVITGLGQTDFTRDSGRSEWELGIDAIRRACADADVDVTDIDGMVNYSYDSVDAAMITRSFGVTLNYYGMTPYGGNGATGLIAHAMAALDARLADVVVCFRALNGRSGTRYGRAERTLGTGATVTARGDRAPSGAYAGPYGLLAPGQVMALWASRYAFEARLSLDDLSLALARIATDQRAYANGNPKAIFYDRPLSQADYLDGRLISSPLRLYDFAMESDGAVAFVLTRRTRPRERDVRVLGASQALPPFAESIAVYGALRNAEPYRHIADRLYADAGCTADDIKVAMLYDATTIGVLLAYEQFGFSSPRSAWAQLTSQGLGLDAPVPVNTHGGHLSEAYVHGLNHIGEAVRQLRHEAANQVDDADVALVNSGPGGIVLGST